MRNVCYLSVFIGPLFADPIISDSLPVAHEFALYLRCIIIRQQIRKLKSSVGKRNRWNYLSRARVCTCVACLRACARGKHSLSTICYTPDITRWRHQNELKNRLFFNVVEKKSCRFARFRLQTVGMSFLFFFAIFGLDPERIPNIKVGRLTNQFRLSEDARSSNW